MLRANNLARLKLEMQTDSQAKPRGAANERSDGSMAVTASALLRALRELIAALDRRVPQAHRASEVSISRDSAALKARATKRIEELERAPGVEKS